MPEVSDSTGVAVRCRLVAPATARRIAPVGAKRHHQSVDVSGDVYHSKPLQFDRCLDQTPNEHEFPLGYLGGVETPKYLMELMLFNSKSRSTCTDFCEEPEKENGVWESRELGVVFLERCLALLEPEGRLAIVLPDTYLFSPKYQWLVDWICAGYTITHSINVPIEAFEPYCRAKTSILVLRKEKPKPGHRIIGMLTESYGQDKKGNPLFRLDKEGNRTEVLEDEMAEGAALLRSRSKRRSKLRFTFEQQKAREAGVLTASYYWRQPYLEALEAFANQNGCALMSIGDLVQYGDLEYTMGHGSPHGQFKGKGTVPYIKVSDIKNWRINENPKYFIPEEIAGRLRRSRYLKSFDIVIPTRASKNIGLGAVIMPWQTGVVLTKEIAVLRCTSESPVSPWLLLVLLSLRVVNNQFRFLVQMQTNREDLGKRLLELRIPVPKDNTVRLQWEQPAEDYFRTQVSARESYATLLGNLDASHFVDRP